MGKSNAKEVIHPVHSRGVWENENQQVKSNKNKMRTKTKMLSSR